MPAWWADAPVQAALRFVAMVKATDLRNGDDVADVGCLDTCPSPIMRSQHLVMRQRVHNDDAAHRVGES